MGHGRVDDFGVSAVVAGSLLRYSNRLLTTFANGLIRGGELRGASMMADLCGTNN